MHGDQQNNVQVFVFYLKYKKLLKTDKFGTSERRKRHSINIYPTQHLLPLRFCTVYIVTMPPETISTCHGLHPLVAVCLNFNTEKSCRSSHGSCQNCNDGCKWYLMRKRDPPMPKLKLFNRRSHVSR